MFGKPALLSQALARPSYLRGSSPADVPDYIDEPAPAPLPPPPPVMDDFLIEDVMTVSQAPEPSMLAMYKMPALVGLVSALLVGLASRNRGNPSYMTVGAIAGGIAGAGAYYFDSNKA